MPNYFIYVLFQLLEGEATPYRIVNNIILACRYTCIENELCMDGMTFISCMLNLMYVTMLTLTWFLIKVEDLPISRKINFDKYMVSSIFFLLFGIMVTGYDYNLNMFILALNIISCLSHCAVFATTITDFMWVGRRVVEPVVVEVVNKDKLD